MAFKTEKEALAATQITLSSEAVEAVQKIRQLALATGLPEDEITCSQIANELLIGAFQPMQVELARQLHNRRRGSSPRKRR